MRSCAFPAGRWRPPAALLSGCATGYLLDNQVQSFSQLQALPAQPTYRFERCAVAAGRSGAAGAGSAGRSRPAQGRPAPRRRRARASACRCRRAPSARCRRMPTRGGWGGGWGLGFGGRRGAIGFGGPWGGMDSPWFHREVSVVVRDWPANQGGLRDPRGQRRPLDGQPQRAARDVRRGHAGLPESAAGPRRVDIQSAARPRS
jgi:hypothetical protein